MPASLGGAEGAAQAATRALGTSLSLPPAAALELPQVLDDRLFASRSHLSAEGRVVFTEHLAQRLR